MKKKKQNEKHRDKKPRAGSRNRRQSALAEVTGVSRENPRKQGWKERLGTKRQGLECYTQVFGLQLHSIVTEES